MAKKKTTTARSTGKQPKHLEEIETNASVAPLSGQPAAPHPSLVPTFPLMPAGFDAVSSSFMASIPAPTSQVGEVASVSGPLPTVSSGFWMRSVASGALLAYAAKTRGWKRWLCAAAGGLFAYRCWRLYKANQPLVEPENRVTRDGEDGMVLEQTLQIQASPSHVYQYFRSLPNMTRWLGQTQRLEEASPTQVHWVVQHAGAGTVLLNAEIIAEIPHKLLAWRSIEGALVSHEGSLHMHALPAGAGTEAHVMLKFDPPASKVFRIVFEGQPEQSLLQGLLRAKQDIEQTEK